MRITKHKKRKSPNKPSGWELPKSLAFDVQDEGCQAQEDFWSEKFWGGYLVHPVMFGGYAADKPATAAGCDVENKTGPVHACGFCEGYNKGFYEGFKYGRFTTKQFYDAIAVAETESRRASLPKPDNWWINKIVQDKSLALKDLAVLECSYRNRYGW
jgi:hypothetical protein